MAEGGGDLVLEVPPNPVGLLFGALPSPPGYSAYSGPKAGLYALQPSLPHPCCFPSLILPSLA